MRKYSVQYLIMHEDEINWEELSADRNDYFSLTEARLFRKKINWDKYLPTHEGYLTDDILEVASKYFTQKDYMLIASFDLAGEDFIRSHLDKFYIPTLILNSSLSEKFLMDIKEQWKDIPDIKTYFLQAKKININSPEYEVLRLYLEVENKF